MTHGVHLKFFGTAAVMIRKEKKKLSLSIRLHNMEFFEVPKTKLIPIFTEKNDSQ